MKQILMLSLRSGLALALCATALTGQSRIKDIVDVQGVQPNVLTSIGLVVGLNKTGDGSSLTQRTAANFLRRAGLESATPGEISTDNMALVLVTASQHAFARPGSALDVTVASIGDASSLRGGQLLITPMKGIDGKVYATASGAVTTGAVTASGASGSSETINHPTAGRVSGGAKVEMAIEQQMVGRSGRITLTLRHADYTTAERIAGAINEAFPGAARPIDAVAIETMIPKPFRRDPVRFLSTIGELAVQIAQRAVVIIDERNGTIVAGGDVVILPGMISKSNLTISVRETPEVSQPNPAAGGDTVVVPRSEVEIRETGTPLIPIKGGVGAAELANSLNALGASSLDLISIFQALKQAGMLHAEVKVQ